MMTINRVHQSAIFERLPDSVRRRYARTVENSDAKPVRTVNRVRGRVRLPLGDTFGSRKTTSTPRQLTRNHLTEPRPLSIRPEHRKCKTQTAFSAVNAALWDSPGFLNKGL